MVFPKILSLALFGLAGAGAGYYVAGNVTALRMNVIQPAAEQAATMVERMTVRPSLAGIYLSSHYAQSQNDWKRATPLLNTLLENDPNNQELIRQAMVLAEGAGDHAQAVKRAQQLIARNAEDGLAYMIVAVHAIAQGQYDESLKALSTLPKNDMSNFILPLIKGWAMAGKGEFDPAMFKSTTMHAYHGALIAHYLKKDDNTVFGFAETILGPSGLTAEEVERAADLMAISGHGKDAINVYKALQAQKGGSDQLAKKIATVEKGEDFAPLMPALAIKTPAQGAANAILDLARILYQENSDSSARVFAQMALDLDPAKVEAHVLIASSFARSQQIDQAIAEYNRITPDHPLYLDSRHEAAQLLAQSGRMDEAVAMLNSLYQTHHNPDSLIRIGDLYRGKEDFKKAIEIYDAVAAKLPDPIPEQYWHLLYARGMTLERMGDWPRAEADLKKALSLQPDHPYIMNYLGYAWIDQGVNMDEAMKMLEQAMALRPGDGYITDSLGWAHYKMKDYKAAVPLLEQAIGIMPYDPEVNSHLGDAYWQVGRKLEARFQWERARNHSKDAKMTERLNEKLAKGLVSESEPKQATSLPAVPAR